jgi:endonuclease G
MAAIPLLFCLFLCGCAVAIEPSAPGPSYYGGLPLPAERVDEVLANTGFTVGYSDGREDPLWVCYEVFAVANPVAHDRPSRFSVDLRTVARVSHDDYTNSGYDRGHMAPNATIDYCYGRQAQLETFLMSNICLQTSNLNRGIWATLEDSERDWANKCGEIWVITGPVFDVDV